jgi:hypothetical protein
MFLICLYTKPDKQLLLVLCSENAYNRCVLFHVKREHNHDLCGFVTELHGFCGR